MKSVVTLHTNARARIESEHPEVISVIRKAFTFVDEKARFTPQFKKGLWDGKISLINFAGVFPIGLVPLVLKIISEKFPGHSVKIKDKRLWPPHFEAKIPTKVGKMELRDYQAEMVRDSFPREYNGLWFPRGIIYAATNAGKSLIAAAITKVMLQNNCKVLFLCHRQEILTQVLSWFTEQLKTDIGVYDRKNHKIRKVTVAMISTIYARRKKAAVMEMLNGFDCLLVDEAHHSTAPSWSFVISSSNAFFKYAFSGTALKLDDYRNLSLVGLFGPVVGQVTNKQLVDLGFSATPHITMVKYKNKDLNEDKEVKLLTIRIAKCYSVMEQMADGKIEGDANDIMKLENIIRELRRKRYQYVYTAGISRCASRINPIVLIIRKHAGKSVLIVINHTVHGKNIHHVLTSQGIECTFVHGNTPDEERKKILKGFVSGKIKVLIASMVYKEGVNVPCIDALVMACGGKAPNTILQVFGRGLRKDPGKEVVDVYDFIDTSHSLLERHTDKRIAIYDGEGFTHKIETF